MAIGSGTRRWLVLATLVALGGALVVLLILRRRTLRSDPPVAATVRQCASPQAAASISASEWSRHQGADVIDPQGERIGTLHAVYVEEVGVPDWGVVNTGRLRVNLRFVPMRDAALLDGRVHVPFPRLVVASAPALDADAWITPDEDEALSSYYNGRRNGDPDR
jgi:hypothetical protein